MIRKMFFLLAAMALTGCATDLREVGKEPALSPVGAGIEGGSASVYQYPQTPAAPVR
jgi:flagellar L-ring protein precursor FlgH